MAENSTAWEGPDSSPGLATHLWDSGRDALQTPVF